MKRSEAIGLEKTLEDRLNSGNGYSITVSMALTGKLKLNFGDSFVSLQVTNPFDVDYINHMGYFDTLMTLITNSQNVLSKNKNLLNKLIWSYEHQHELLEDIDDIEKE